MLKTIIFSTKWTLFHSKLRYVQNKICFEWRGKKNITCPHLPIERYDIIKCWQSWTTDHCETGYELVSISIVWMMKYYVIHVVLDIPSDNIKHYSDWPRPQFTLERRVFMLVNFCETWSKTDTLILLVIQFPNYNKYC